MILSKKGIVYELFEGNGSRKENLVFVHGSGCNKKFLQAMQNCLQEFNCFFIDLPGHGESKNRSYSKDSYVDAVCNFVRDIDNVVLIGHSLGGTIVLEASSKNIDTIKKAIILNSGAAFPKLNKEFATKIHKGIIDFDYFLKCLGHSDNKQVQEAIDTFEAEEIIIKDFIIDESIDVTFCLKNIDIPILIVTGGDEILTLVEYSQLINQEVKNSKLVVVPNSRHMLPIAKREYVCDLIKEFIN
ncbi:alpha/beta fold hydrolase [Clostridium sp. BJN0013]|uniref:alpha/beta fold hydrolase n=1 Tax=Clostridium sp. BJN0013 TaxID=3236840 RepID=UPI0034C5B4E8